MYPDVLPACFGSVPSQPQAQPLAMRSVPAAPVPAGGDLSCDDERIPLWADLFLAVCFVVVAAVGAALHGGIKR